MNYKTYENSKDKKDYAAKIGGIVVSILLVFAFVVASIFAIRPSVCKAATDFKTVGKSAYLVDYATGELLYARNEKGTLAYCKYGQNHDVFAHFRGGRKGRHLS